MHRLAINKREFAAAVAAAAHCDDRLAVGLAGRSAFIMTPSRPVFMEVPGRYVVPETDEANGLAYVCARCLLYALGTVVEETAEEVVVSIPVDGGHAYIWAQGGLYRVPRGGEDGHCGRFV